MALKDMTQFMVFDVESIRLHGEGFAVGWVLVNRKGVIQAEWSLYADPTNAEGEDGGREWVRQNVILPSKLYPHPKAIRERFWQAWLRAKADGYTLWADVTWPVEANFLEACIKDWPKPREFSGPYPLYDIATLRLAAGFDPLGIEPRTENELPAHDPLCDARQSARLLIDAIQVLS